MAVNLSPVGGVAGQFFDNNGNPLSGGKIFTYSAGTTTPLTTYTTSGGSVPHANPIILDAAGRVPGGEIWLTDGLQYKFILQTSTSVQIGSYDNIIGINSNFVNYTNAQEIQTATAGQTVFTLTTMQYQPGTNSLSVFVDGVNQYGPGAMYAYQETSSTVVTFTAGLHVGAQVKFVTSAINASSYGDAEQISYNPPFTGGAATNVEAKLAQTVSVKDFGAVGNGVTDDTAAIQAAIDYAASLVNTTYFSGETIALNGTTVYFPPGTYIVTSTINFKNGLTLKGSGVGSTVLKSSYDGYIIRNEIYPLSYNFHYGSILDLTILGDKTKTNQIGIALLRDTSGTYKNICVLDVGLHGFQLLQCIATYLTNIQAIRCGGVGLYITSGQNSWVDPTPNNLPTNTITCVNGYFRTNDAEGILLTQSCNGNTFISCVAEYNYASSGSNTGYQIRLENTNNNMPNEFINCWVEGPCQSHIYINSPGSLDNRITNLKHFANGTTGNVDRAIIINAGAAQVIGAFGQSSSYKTINGSNAPFRIVTPNATIKVVDCVGNLITNNNFVEDQLGNTTGLFNYVKMNNFGAAYGGAYAKGPSGSVIDFWQQETQAQPFLGVQTGFGLAFGDGTNPMDAFLQHGGANVVAVRNGTLFNTGSTWNGSHLIMGGFHLWVDGSGRLRIKFGAPTSDTDGTVVGTQS